MLETKKSEINFKKLRACNQAIAFARVSKHDQAEGASLDAQMDKIEQYCDGHNFTIIQRIKLLSK